MTEEYQFIKKRLLELARKSFSAGIYTFTDFLGLEEQSAFAEIKHDLKGIKYVYFGGAYGTSRVMIRFGDEEALCYAQDFPIKILKAVPKAQKWADKLTHRDILGAIMNLGIERALIGDIVIRENEAFIFVHERIAEFIKSELLRAKHTDLTVSEAESLPEGPLFKTEGHAVQCNTPRADAVLAKLFSLSREESVGYFKRGLIFIDGKLCTSPSRELKDGEIVSVRTKGRFIYKGVTGLSKKGKMNILLEVFV